MKKRIHFLSSLAASGFLFVLAGLLPPAFCAEVSPELSVTEVAHGQFDECYMGMGSADSYFNPGGLTPDEVEHCEEAGGLLKTNRGYLWGLASSGDTLWFGTGSNILAVGFGAFLENRDETSERDLEEIITGTELADIVTEYTESTYKDGELGLLGDYRPPGIYTYDTGARVFRDMTPQDPLIEKTFGIRSAACFNGVVLLAGPYMDRELKGITLFAFNSQTREYLGSACLRTLVNDAGQVVADEINNIRKWLVVDNILYTTIGTTSGGNVLRWKGSVNNPFAFDVVGILENQGSDLVLHDNHLFVFTWPPAQDFTGVTMEVDTSRVCDIVMSKNEIPAGGLTAGTEFVKVWSVSDYEPDPVTASTYGLGAAASYGGYLYWGTMHVPLAGGVSQIKANRDDFRRLSDIKNAFFYSNRKASVFRGRNFTSDHPQIDILYGEEDFYQYQGDGQWDMVPNKMNQIPLYGDSGVDSRTNYYCWSMKEYKGQLYMGMFDASFTEDGALFSMMFKTFLNFWIDNIPYREDYLDIREMITPPDNVPGGDLFRFPDSESPAVAETNDCFGYQGTYGFRNMIVVDDALYAGTASSFNLHPDGGWKLLELKKEDTPESDDDDSVLSRILDFFRR